MPKLSCLLHGLFLSILNNLRSFSRESQNQQLLLSAFISSRLHLISIFLFQRETIFFVQNGENKHTITNDAQYILVTDIFIPCFSLFWNITVVQLLRWEAKTVLEYAGKNHFIGVQKFEAYNYGSLSQLRLEVLLDKLAQQKQSAQSLVLKNPCYLSARIILDFLRF